MKRNDLNTRQIDSMAIVLPSSGSRADRSGARLDYRDNARDIALLKLIGRGSTLALLELYDFHHREAFRRALRVVSDLESAERALRNAFLVLWREGSAFDPKTCLVKDWLLNLVSDFATEESHKLASAACLKGML